MAGTFSQGTLSTTSTQSQGTQSQGSFSQGVHWEVGDIVAHDDAGVEAEIPEPEE